MFSNVWSENTALFERLMEIHSNSPKLYYGFKVFQNAKVVINCLYLFLHYIYFMNRYGYSIWHSEIKMKPVSGFQKANIVEMDCLQMEKRKDGKR